VESNITNIDPHCYQRGFMLAMGLLVLFLL